MRAVIALALVAGSATAAPHLYADPYPATGVQPDAAEFTVNGGAPQPCELVSVAGGVQPKCDLAALTAPGTYTLVMTVTKAGGIINTPTGAVNTSGGSASSAPFRYELVIDGVGTPTLRVAP